jgi:hypothetical protein
MCKGCGVKWFIRGKINDKEWKLKLSVITCKLKHKLIHKKFCPETCLGRK